MNTLMNGLKSNANIGRTENGAVKHYTTQSKLLDMFAMGAAMRQRSVDDVVNMFSLAYNENPEYALKCLFYIRDVRGGQGERRFFRENLKWLAVHHPEAVLRNLEYIPEFGRWDDLYCMVGMNQTIDTAIFAFIKKQLMLDVQCKTPSLLAKWLKSENASSKETCRLGDITRQHLGLTHKQYRQILSVLRTRINIVEKLMSENRWDEIEFDKIPSKAGMIYKNAFARRDIIKTKYEKFAKDTTTKVNAKTLYPYEVVKEAIKVMHSNSYYSYGRNSVALDNVDRLMVNKYWDNLADYFDGASLNALCMVDTSGSMTCGSADVKPIDVAVSLGLYCAEKARGPFAGHYISFSSRPQLIECTGVDFCDKVHRIVSTNLCQNTNIEAAFDMVLNTAIRNHVPQDDMPKNIIVISDMEFDQARDYSVRHQSNTTLMENIARKWQNSGYQMPHLIYWNVNARTNNIPMLGKDAISFVSGFSPSIFQTIMSGKTGYDLMMECLNKERYAVIK